MTRNFRNMFLKNVVYFLKFVTYLLPESKRFSFYFLIQLTVVDTGPLSYSNVEYGFFHQQVLCSQCLRRRIATSKLFAWQTQFFLSLTDCKKPMESFFVQRPGKQDFRSYSGMKKVFFFPKEGRCSKYNIQKLLLFRWLPSKQTQLEGNHNLTSFP